MTIAQLSTRSNLYRMLYFPLTRIIIGIIICVAVVITAQALMKEILEIFNITGKIRVLLTASTGAIMAVASYSVLYRYYEKRSITELSTKSIVRDGGWGILLGLVLQSLTILTIYVLATYDVLAVNPLSFLIIPLAMSISSSVIEEVLFRGILFRIIEQSLGSYMALGISALIFGILHMSNPNSSILMGMGIAIQAGILLGVAYIFTRNLWFPIAIHFAWNFTQTGIYGAATSGYHSGNRLFVPLIEGPQWITGGAFGPEGSVQATVFCLFAAVILMIYSHKKGNIIPFRNQPKPTRV